MHVYCKICNEKYKSMLLYTHKKYIYYRYCLLVAIMVETCLKTCYLGQDRKWLCVCLWGGGIRIFQGVTMC